MTRGRDTSSLATGRAPRTRRAAIVLGGVVAAAVGCFKPNISEGGFTCAASGKACPDGFQCDLANKRCYRPGNIPPVVDAGMEAPPLCTIVTVTPLCDEGPDGGEVCDPTCQRGCACGRCNVVGSTATCVAVGKTQLGAVCKPGADDCAPGLVCLKEVCGNALGRCYQFCTEDKQCSNAICQIPVDDSQGHDTGFKTCDVPPYDCDPVENSGCPNPAFNCYLTSLNQTLCDCPSATVGQNDAPCTIYNDCAPGFVCIQGVGGETTAHCHFACKLASPACPTGTTCTPEAAGATFGYCG